MASLKSAVTCTRLHVALDERGRVKGGNTSGLCAPSFAAALVILIFLLFIILHHLTFRQRPKERCCIWGVTL